MKRLYVTQVYNPVFFGDSTPNVDKYLYQVSKVINSTALHINEELTKTQVAGFAYDADWTVTIT